MENCKTKAVGSFAHVNKIASEQIQGLDEYTHEEGNIFNETCTNQDKVPKARPSLLFQFCSILAFPAFFFAILKKKQKTAPWALLVNVSYFKFIKNFGFQ